MDTSSIDFERRFGGIMRLYGAEKFQRLREMRICIIGVGGVGSWIAEACARSAIGHLTLIDLDHVAESNINRQLQALSNTLGQAKVLALADRIAQINPLAVVQTIEEFISPDNVSTYIQAAHVDYVIDAMDDVTAKCALIDHCRTHDIPLVTIGAAGGQIDPTRIEVRDLARTEQEPLLACVRKKLRQQYHFPRGSKNKFGIDAVFSTEPLVYPDMHCDLADDNALHVNGDLNCAGLGSSVMVTATFGLVAAAHVINCFLKAK